MESSHLELFQKAATFAKSKIGSMETGQILNLYGLYKQATEGSNKTPRPNFWNVTAKQKWEAWSAHGEKSKESAMNEYVLLVSDFDPEWNEKSIEDQFWVSHSVMTNDEEVIPDIDKTIFDWIKETNLDKVKECFSKDALNISDDDGLFLIHWAADRGDVSVVNYLITSGADLDVQDGEGQTALHYAASCGHGEVVTALLNAGARKDMTDVDGQTPRDAAAHPDIADLLS